MMTLDAVYHALKAAGEPDHEPENMDAPEAMANFFAACCRDSSADEDEFKRRYDDLAPKALVLITTTIGVLTDLAAGKADPDLDAFLAGLSGGKAN